MQRRRFCILAATPMALLLACAAAAQTAPPQQTPPSGQPQALPPAQNRESTEGVRQSMGRSSGAQEFSTLAGSKGYVTRSEATSDPWLARHFAQCDREHNGKVTRTEFAGCRQS